MNEIQKNILNNMNIDYHLFRDGDREDSGFKDCIFWETWVPYRVCLVVFADGSLVAYNDKNISYNFTSIDEQSFKFLFKTHAKLKLFE